MEKVKMLVFRITPEQAQLLDEKARANGFLKKTEYIRSILFKTMSMEEKIDQIHKKVCKDG
ncbi:MAG: hypothetical protein V1735_08100 [Nanoarchaeota archaeon]